MTDTIEPEAGASEPSVTPAVAMRADGKRTDRKKPTRLWMVYGGSGLAVVAVLAVVGGLAVAHHNDDADQTASDAPRAMTAPAETLNSVADPAPAADKKPAAQAESAPSAPATPQPSSPEPTASVPAPELALAERVGAVEAKVEALAAKPEPVSAADMQTMSQRVQALESNTAQIGALQTKLSDLRQSLEALQKQEQAIVTQNHAQHDFEALRHAYPAAAKAALAASRPENQYTSFWKRLKARATSLIVVRRGDAVLIGDPAAGILQAAQTKLDADDLGGALVALDRLTGPARTAMQGWVAQAKPVQAALTAAP